MKWYQLKQREIEQELQVVVKQGLTDEQVKARRDQFGLNKLIEPPRESLWVLFIKQFQDFMVLILLAATLIAGLLGEYIDALAIMLIVLLNGFLGFFQEQRAEKSLEKLKELSAPMIRVLREEIGKRFPQKRQSLVM